MKNKESSKKKVLLWAVDPFDADTKPTAAAVNRMAKWAEGLGLMVQPVFVLSIPMDALERGVLSAVSEAEIALDKFVAEYAISGVLAAEVVLDDSNNRLGAVRALLAFARKWGAESIALSSHGRAGLKRFVFGSFAENLLRESPAPILFLSRELPPAASPAILFPTDFSPMSHSAFKKILRFARPNGMEVVIFHAISLPAPVFEGMATAVPSAYIPENYFAGEEARARKRGQAWIKEAASLKVNARLALSDRGIGLLTGDVILQAADRARASLIALSMQSSAFEHLVFGSAALTVFRAGRFPVWICGPNFSPAREAKRLPVNRRKKRPLPARKKAARTLKQRQA